MCGYSFLTVVIIHSATAKNSVLVMTTSYCVGTINCKIQDSAQLNPYGCEEMLRRRLLDFMPVTYEDSLGFLSSQPSFQFLRGLQ
ncbi:GDP-Man:Man(3)GlcNAc(2)-PP-Dol alpha-1,2-mannosyltransferase [Frankliniella fusca]|uniref:GDP-Man:Man(3)GlcNAc(2)-PP-Dol alpha-1,2-mannosyltransferase n=1 Tax=Frankliniella fusca TaxID=407009 RepID=A0AAE1H826_9NEOP|nr:GDP-Man:Man(3)GlcNAc(2)-PP-Dol alpha-1,2-mannosyltransferase [Frankliniella fusca]KAK3919245.1 GDP-Man:Man(3)GlcNAc(2)-PP-Dol alpha-1,2-mannosyltransferase [Frankliniella fusca]